MTTLGLSTIKKQETLPDTQTKKFHRIKPEKSRIIQFLIGLSLGAVLGISIHLPIMKEILTTDPEIFYARIIQIPAALFFIAFVTVMTGFRLVAVFVGIEHFEIRRYITDGILLSFTFIQLVLFFSGHVGVIVPI